MRFGAGRAYRGGDRRRSRGNVSLLTSCGAASKRARPRKRARNCVRGCIVEGDPGACGRLRACAGAGTGRLRGDRLLEVELRAARLGLGFDEAKDLHEAATAAARAALGSEERGGVL